jgi:DUF177 domain-containing protein
VTRGAAPFVVSIAELRRTPGTQRLVELSGPLPGLAVSSAGVPDDAPVTAALTLELLVDGRLTATGDIEAAWQGTCRRCLGPVEGVARVHVQEVFERDPAPDAETYRLEGDRVDLGPMVRDAVLLALPLAPLCRPDCPGPDPQHPVAVAGEEPPAGGDEEVSPDPRWATLRDLKFD